ncbi:MAG: SurA N-terminal domain-containing protein, partial [Prolixibacteraceae bacterium]|nr:SurA N-terminal domain-containing protein [Prolixibacteraceae bacterium]
MAEENMIINGKEIKPKEPKVKKPFSLKGAFIRNRKKILLIGGILFLSLVVVGGVLAFWYFSPVATVNGEKISRSEYNEAKLRLEKFYKYNSDSQGQKNLANNTKDKLIESEIIRLEAKKRGVTATTEEINAKYNDLVKKYKSEDEFKQTISNAYGYTPELAKETIVTNILRDKLKPLVLRGYDISIFMVRYDQKTGGSKENLSAKPTIEAYNKQLLAGKTLEDLSKDSACEYPACLLTKQSSVNQETAAEIFFASKGEDYAAISKLTKAGETTGIVRSSGGYYAIYRADRVYGGSYDTWEAFIKDYKNKYVTYNMATRVTAAYRRIANWLVKQLVPKAYAASAPCSYNAPWGPEDVYSPVQIHGYVTDSVTGERLNGVKVYERISNYNDQCYLQYRDSSRTTTISFANPHDNATVYTGADSQRPWDGYYIFRGDDRAECHFHWWWTYSKAGYYDHSITGQGVGNGQTYRWDVELVPIPWSLSGSSTASPGTIYRNQTTTFTHSVRNDGPGDSKAFTSRVRWTSGSGIVQWISNVGDANQWLPSLADHSAKSSGESINPSRVNTFNAVNLGSYCQTISARPNSSSDVGWSEQSSACVNVVERPWTINGASSVSSLGRSIRNAAGALYVKAGDRVTFSHSVTNVGPESTEQQVNGNVQWTTHPSGARVITSYSHAAGWAAGATYPHPDPTTLIIPASDQPGGQSDTMYCQNISWAPTANTNPGWGNSGPVCVIVTVPTLQDYEPISTASGDYEK